MISRGKKALWIEKQFRQAWRGEAMTNEKLAVGENSLTLIVSSCLVFLLEIRIERKRGRAWKEGKKDVCVCWRSTCLKAHLIDVEIKWEKTARWDSINIISSFQKKILLVVATDWIYFLLSQQQMADCRKTSA